MCSHDERPAPQCQGQPRKGLGSDRTSVYTCTPALRDRATVSCDERPAPQCRGQPHDRSGLRPVRPSSQARRHRGLGQQARTTSGPHHSVGASCMTGLGSVFIRTPASRAPATGRLRAASEILRPGHRETQRLQRGLIAQAQRASELGSHVRARCHLRLRRALRRARREPPWHTKQYAEGLSESRSAILYTRVACSQCRTM